ncbi:MAG: hypothetical protein A4E73_02036 [Syntrophaceae bacterium PtaU1.Bin231]|nr:MAG: hypothetical protein A4E73_02036 [Syntrophaceae bacterium PtaU1.Bin231]HOG17723.1 hypothetical protein [Syntrophales bacterium]
MEELLDKIAEKILHLDEASLSGLWQKYKDRMERFEPTKEWEKAVVVFFIINSVRVKNHLFNQHLLQTKQGADSPPGPPPAKRPDLKLVK